MQHKIVFAGPYENFRCAFCHGPTINDQCFKCFPAINRPSRTAQIDKAVLDVLRDWYPATVAFRGIGFAARELEANNNLHASFFLDVCEAISKKEADHAET